MEVFPVNRKKNNGVTLKGFTILEMLIVIAIFGILASVASIAAGSFIRTAKIREANANAEAVYLAVSDWLIDMEVNDIEIGDTPIRSLAGEPMKFQYEKKGNVGSVNVEGKFNLVGNEIMSGSWRAHLGNANQYQLDYVLWVDDESGGQKAIASDGQMSSADQEAYWTANQKAKGCYPLKITK